LSVPGTALRVVLASQDLREDTLEDPAMARSDLGLRLPGRSSRPVAAQPASSLDPSAAGQTLADLALPASQFSLPTGGAVVSSAVRVRAQDAGKRNGEYCKVLGRIKPVDQAAPDIGFQVNLPSTWNGKALQVGGGGCNGNIPNTLGAAPHGVATAPTPLAQGQATLAGDSGHQTPDANEASFALNEEALANYAGQHVKKTRDAAAALVQQRYGSAVRRMYFMGGSTGGREALTAALRWPEAYDGVVSHYPTANFMGLRLWGSALARAIYPDNSAGWIPPAMVARIAAEALQDCDPLDGVVDGLVSHMTACRARSAALLERLRCRNGETGHPAHCLTPAQLGTIAVHHEGYRLALRAGQGPYHLPGLQQPGGHHDAAGLAVCLHRPATYRAEHAPCEPRRPVRQVLPRARSGLQPAAPGHPEPRAPAIAHRRAAAADRRQSPPTGRPSAPAAAS
jgi:hypothetical protein